MTEGRRRDADKETFETIGQIKEFMANYQRDRDIDRAARASDRDESRQWRESFASEQDELRKTVQNLKERFDNLTAPGRWVVGLAVVITSVGAIAAIGKKLLMLIRG
jgi:methyl-accepting chemotaxis protein